MNKVIHFLASNYLNPSTFNSFFYQNVQLFQWQLLSKAMVTSRIRSRQQQAFWHANCRSIENIFFLLLINKSTNTIHSFYQMLSLTFILIKNEKENERSLFFNNWSNKYPALLYHLNSTCFRTLWENRIEKHEKKN